MESIRIGNRVVGENAPVFVIAEAGINHNGSRDLAKPCNWHPQTQPT